MLKTVRSVLLIGLGVAACGESGVPVGPSSEVAQLRALALSSGLTPLSPPPVARPELVELGRALAFDKILSGNRDVSCMTCHLPRQGTSDGLSLSIGVGAAGLGPDRQGGVFIPRNSLPLFNLHALRMHFWDGRLEMDGPSGMRSPAGPLLTGTMMSVFEFLPTSALALFPVLSREEMRGFGGNELAEIEDDDLTAIWAALLGRLGEIPQYRTLFESAYPGLPFEEMTFAHAANAIAAFLFTDFAALDSPWDRFLGGDDRSLTSEQLEGLRIFLGPGRCSQCHRGATLSDQEFHNTALAQLGPGKGHGPAGNADFGREAESGGAGQRYAFRTAPLRNVSLTAPYGHAGQFARLRDMVDHYSHSELKLRSYDPGNVDPRLQATVSTSEEILSTRDPRLDGLVLSEVQVDHLVAFLASLTDDRSRNLDRVVPSRVPSGLPIDR